MPTTQQERPTQSEQAKSLDISPKRIYKQSTGTVTDIQHH